MQAKQSAIMQQKAVSKHFVDAVGRNGVIARKP
jgi:hypothetical protein